MSVETTQVQPGKGIKKNRYESRVTLCFLLATARIARF